MNRSLITVLCVVILAAVAYAAEPQSKPARTALDRYAAARSKIDAEYQAKLANLNRNLAADLQAAIKAATKAGDLDEANAIKAVLEKMLGRIQTFQIDAAKDWQPTITVKKGQKISIEAEGEWCANVAEGQSATYGPQGGVYRGQPFFFLEGRIGSAPFHVDGEWNGVADADGVIELRMHDLVHTDNSGSMAVSISVK